ncbi:glutaredoxin [Anoxybacillus voinovskiensis]|uniref:Glutaredoxin n=1 Tax=Anoxybacteroides voinovskiense TaxID=230470 RepID=A0A840DUI8_9BACL|nr:glutaredoxin family protein [Anoxybacillus voinovskiensis]MBB4073688.1 glutaredoxin [Anoxybacillus voinovskiensis]GGJ64615.1 thioredoxin family protein [Anoxybacillus voinovskiensis]
MIVTLYSKIDCPLCEKAKAVLQELQQEYGFEINEIDIYKDDALLEKYQLMIPVVEVDGEELAYGRIHKEFIRKRLLERMNS